MSLLLLKSKTFKLGATSLRFPKKDSLFLLSLSIFKLSGSEVWDLVMLDIKLLSNNSSKPIYGPKFVLFNAMLFGIYSRH
jgi:hypothetical protein